MFEEYYILRLGFIQYGNKKFKNLEFYRVHSAQDFYVLFQHEGILHWRIFELEEPYIGEFVYWRNIYRHT